MAENHQTPVLFYIFALFALIYLVYNLRRFFTVREGKPETDRPVNFLSAFFNGLFFGIGQRRVYRKTFTYAAVMHFLLGWGFIELFFATTVDFFTARGWFAQYLPELDTPWFAALNDLGGLMLLAGLIMALYRRYFARPEPLPQDGFGGRWNLLGDTGILLFLLLLDLGGFLTEAARLAVTRPETAAWSWIGYPLSKTASVSFWEAIRPWLWWFHAVTALAFIAILPLTKMFHALAVIVNVALTNRDRRGRVRPMHVSQLMEDPDMDLDNLTLGVNKVKEFTWKQLLDSIACTECARCTSVCPAYNTGKPLSPMKIITDIRHSLYDQTLGGGEEKELINGKISETELWSCTTCAACMEECPVLIDHVPTFTDLRRFLVLSEGKPPTQAAPYLEKMMNNGNPWGFAQSDRTKWALEGEIELPLFSDKRKAQVLYWVGCAGAYDPRNQQVARAMVKIFERAGVDFAVLGNEERCTGDSARRLGDEYLFETLALQNIETLNKYEFDRIVTACPHCLHTLKNEYPDFGGRYKVQHHSQFINELLKDGKLKISSSYDQKITYHDPCYLGRYNGEYNAPRELIRSTLRNGGLVEMERHRNTSFCCGAGGGNMWHEIDQGERVNLRRFQEAIDSGAQTVATACSFCLIMMDDALKVKEQETNMRVLDLAELVTRAMAPEPD
ncbi:MAG: (Fe-S)-binding protein [FCB group bacterium]|nr:(Fe-S)-binding protein [FCB group bacterium]